MSAATFRIESSEPDRCTLHLGGDWTAMDLGRLPRQLVRSLNSASVTRLEVSGLASFDTAGAFALVQALRGRVPREGLESRPEISGILDLVERAYCETPRKAAKTPSLTRVLMRIGRGASDIRNEALASLAFLGELSVATMRTVFGIDHIRWPAWFSLIERAGLDALPIVVVTNFFIGAVIAFLGADLLALFGATVFAVELIGIAVLREFAVVITAVLLAGRSASAFAAEIGSMKMNQEVDAMRVLGVDPFEALVIPRLAALVIMLPLLTFVAMLAGLAGGLLVTWANLEISPIFFFQRIEANVGATHMWVGLSKAPVFALVVAAIGCRQGMAVGGDVESLGRRVTAAVVQSIFAIIAIDAIFALIYLEAGV